MTSWFKLLSFLYCCTMHISQNPTYPYPHPVFSLQDAYFNLLFVTLTVGYYMMYVLRESVCD